MSIVCDTGFINIVDPFLNPDSTVWTGSITYTLQYATTVAGATLVEARQVINVSDGIDICLAPGLYTVVYNQSGQRLPVTSQWTVPPTGGPYTIADLEVVGPVTGSLTVTGPFIAMSTVTMTSLINAAARPYVATDSVGLLSTGNLALIAISGSASDLASGTVAAARGGAGTLSGLLKANGAGVVSAAVAGTDYAVATNGTNAQFLTSNGAGGFGTAVSSTGSGSVVLATSPSLTTPDLGTPSVLVLTNATGLPAAAMPGLTGDVTSSAGSVATTVVKINGTTLSGLATGLLKNTTATGVPSIAVAGTDLIGGVGNLTTVGSVPYVSASGILNQDAGQFFWDATNNRLGIGTATPSTPLHIQTTTGYGLRLTGAGVQGGSDATNGAAINLSYNASGNRQFWIGDTATNFGVRLINSQMDGFDLSAGTSRGMVLQVNGNPLSIGTGATGYSLQVYGNSALNASGVFNAASSAGASYLMVNNTGNVGIGTTAPLAPLQTSLVSTATINEIGAIIERTGGPASGLARGIGIVFKDASNATLVGGVAGIREGPGNDWAGGLAFFSNAAGLNSTTFAGLTERMRILGNGNVGIGTATPGVTLDAVGPIGGPASSGSTQTGVFRVGNTTSSVVMDFGVSANVSPFPAWIQVTNKSTLSTYLPLALQPNGGNVGIGTITPAQKLEVAGIGRFTGTGAFSIGDEAGAVRITSNNASPQLFGLFSATNNYTGIRVGAISVGTTYAASDAPASGMIVQGNVGIGTTTPATRLQIGNYTAGTDEKITVAAGNGYSAALRLYDFSTAYGFTIQDNGGSGYLEFLRHNNSVPGVSAMVISRTNGSVGIGVAIPTYQLDVGISAGSGTARFYDQTATTGATRVVITRGAADTTSTQVFEIGGLMKFSGLNSTGAGTALLGTNSPATTNAAPYTWLKVLTSDGSTGYIPVWK